MRLRQKVCLVTGAADGIGLAISGAFVREGARVLIGDIQDEKGAAEAAALTQAGPGSAVARYCDVSRTADVDAFVAAAVERFGRIDVLVNNAAIAVGGKITEMPEESWARVIDVNLTSAFRTCRAAFPHLLRAGGGSVINIASVHGYVGFDGWTAYATAKGGLLAMTRQLAKEFGPQKIRVNSISPGGINTPLNARRASVEAPGREAEYFRAMGHMHALDRMGDSAEVAAAAVFLASDESSFVTGADLKVDGGLTVCARE